MADALHDLPCPARPNLPRSDEILDACKTTFAQKGFDGASMQDLARAAGMSASNFYRYFPSKDAIVVALVDREMAEIADRFSGLAGADPLRPALMQTLAAFLRRQKDDADGALWAQMQAAAPRRPAVAQALQRMEDTVTARLLGVFARMGGHSRAEAEARFRPHAAMLFLLSRGALMTRCGVTRPPGVQDSDQVIALVLRAVGQVLDDIETRG